MFFVVTTGRSGSVTLANALAQHPECQCGHETRQELISAATRYIHHELSRERVSELLALLFPPERSGSPLQGEVDSKLSFVIPPLRDVHPEARFIWLRRNARDVVASVVSHGLGWYSERDQDEAWRAATAAKDPAAELWMRYRITGPGTGDVPEEQWSTMSAFERCCWYWVYTNRLIESHLRECAPSMVMTVELERLDSYLPRMLEFLGLRPAPLLTPHLNTNRSPTLSWKFWDESQKRAFERWCGDAMDEWYPEWRSADGAWQEITYGSRPSETWRTRAFRASRRAPFAQRLMLRLLDRK